MLFRLLVFLLGWSPEIRKRYRRTIRMLFLSLTLCNPNRWGWKRSGQGRGLHDWWFSWLVCFTPKNCSGPELWFVHVHFIFAFCCEIYLIPLTKSSLILSFSIYIPISVAISLSSLFLCVLCFSSAFRELVYSVLSLLWTDTYLTDGWEWHCKVLPASSLPSYGALHRTRPPAGSLQVLRRRWPPQKNR